MIITVIATRFGDKGPGAPIKSTTANIEVAPPQNNQPTSTFTPNDSDTFDDIVQLFNKK